MAKGKVKGPYQGVYEGMDFPEYKYERFPLMLTGDDPSKGEANQHVVHNAEEEAAAVAKGWKVPEKIGAPITLTGDEVKRKDAHIAGLEAEIAALRAKAQPEAKVEPPKVQPQQPVKPAVAPASASPK